jgi:Uma2 family endonuclease
MRVRIGEIGSYVYPDIVVVCGTPELEDAELDTLLNPTVIVEVLSPSTEMVDRGTKFQRYRSIPSLREYVLVSQDAYHIEHYVRQDDDQWLFSDAVGEAASLELPSIDCTLALADVYAKVTFEGDSGTGIQE